jgi:hypothetical protein
VEELETSELPLVEFFSIYSDIRPPQPASRDVAGSLPARAARVCPPVTSASAFGWYVYPPVDFAVRWNGGESEWSLLEGNEPVLWRSLGGGYDAPLPFAKDAVAQLPAEWRERDGDVFDPFGGVPSFIDADPRGPERIELNIGMLIRSRPGWLVHVREAPNWPRVEGVQIYEGLLECEWYRSYMPVIIRLTTQNKVVRFYKHLPLVAVQAIPASVIEANRGPAPTRAGLAEMPEDVWREFVAWRRDRDDPEKAATYARRHREFARETGRPREEI